ncbi:MAG: ABC transporter permease [Bacteroidales bacterium]|jgi:ABC-2 type transport system permease protein|nr:ABC transporter permease [Bacteroidales bacterium]
MSNPIRIIIEREYLTRVKKKSFIVMTLLAPILLVVGYGLIIYLMISDATASKKNVMIWDESELFYETFKSNDQYAFSYIFPDNLDKAKEEFNKSDDYALIYIPKTQTIVPEAANIFSKNQISMNVKSYIGTAMQKEIEKLKLRASGVSDEIMESIKSSGVIINTIRLAKDGVKEERSYPEIRMILSYISGVLLYFVIFFFGGQVMNGVTQEKTNRVVEVMVSTVKPIQLMAGKIIGIALVGLTQFLLWIIFTAVILIASSVVFTGSVNPETVTQLTRQIPAAGVDANTIIAGMTQEQGENIQYIMESIMSVNYGVILISFLFYFVFGYLLYASMFSAIGSVVDNESDMQQFTLPVTIPLIIALVMAFQVPNNPDGTIAVALSLIPFTSPITMMARLPFGVPWWEIIVSIALLIGTVWTITWLSAKIYRTGILMYGKKISYKELVKWIKQK